MAYTNIDDPSAFFQTALWTGDGTAGNAVTFDGNSDMQPDFVWSKRRDVGFSHVLKDTSRGGTSNNDLHLLSDLTNAESTYAQYRMDFNSDGFTLDGAGDSGFQGSGTSMVSWAWKANGGTTTSNTDGSITSTVQVNQDAGFSIGTFTGNGTSGATVGHGLGVKPDMLILKSRNSPSGAAMYWIVGHVGLDGMAGLKNLFMNENWAVNTQSVIWANTAPTSSVFSVGTNAAVNYTNNDMLFYAFAEKQGYSKFGKYVGNGNANGPFVYTGFKPAWVMIKISSGTTEQWSILDTKRNDTGNPLTKELFADSADADYSGGRVVDFLSNGFKPRLGGAIHNGSGYSYIYMAFAENPFTTSTGIPTTAR